MRKVTAVHYEGTIDLHGEEGFTDIEATVAPFEYRTFQEFAWAQEDGRPAGKSLPGH
jgi:hypothetical protein